MRAYKLANDLLFGLGLLLVTAGCGGSGGGVGGGGGGNGGGAAVPNIYVTQDNDFFLPPLPSSVLQFSTTADGTGPPISTITGPGDVLFQGLALDAAGNQYVGGEIYNPNTASLEGVEILVYALDATGTANPIRTLGLPTGSVSNSIGGIALNSAGNIYVSTTVAVGPGIVIFSSTSNGNVSPTNLIAGSATTIGAEGQIAVDSAGNIYVGNGAFQGPDSILIFNSSATGNVAPARTLGGSNTMIGTVKGIALDSAGNIYVANGNTGNVTPGILEFSAGSMGNVAPIRTISGSATTMGGVGNISLDAAGNIYLINESNILKFAPDAMGNVPPIATISSVGFAEVNSIAVH